MPITSRKTPDTLGPITPVSLCSREASSDTSPERPLIPHANSAASTNTIEEWPREKKNPTLSGR